MRLHAMTSLRVRLVLWLLLPLSLLVALCGWLSWRNAASVADYVQDHDLLASAKVLSDRLIWEDNDVHASVPPAALIERAVARAQGYMALPPQAFATTKRELRAPQLARIASARAGLGEPRLDFWLGEEMRRASASVLRGGA